MNIVKKFKIKNRLNKTAILDPGILALAKNLSFKIRNWFREMFSKKLNITSRSCNV